MHPLLELHKGGFWLLMGIYFLFSNVVGALPVPTDKSSTAYTFVYRLVNGMAANLSTAFKKKFPQGIPNQKPGAPK